MKNLLFFFSCLMVAAISFNSCMKRHDHEEDKTVVLNVPVSAGQPYQLDLSQYADQDDIASIVTPASHSTVSEINLNAAGKYIYTYTAASTLPKVNTGTNDYVVLKVAEPECRRHHEQTTIAILFTIK